MKQNSNILFVVLTILCIEKISFLKAQTPNGALIATYFNSEVGYNLDEIPDYAIDEAKNYVLYNVTDDQWVERAKMQITATIYRQVFRVFYFAPKLQLTLPPLDVWDINLTSKPVVKRIEDHLYISRNFSFYSILIGDAKSINDSEPALNTIGGKFSDEFILPVDPEHVFQRSGYACADEASFSLDTVTSENFLTYFDQECKVEPYIPIWNRTIETNENCHWTEFPKETCIEALTKYIGSIKININWERIQWNSTLADKYRFGEQKSDRADMEGVTSKLIDEINIGYKFFKTDSCALSEGGSGTKKGCINAPGWRQLLKFTSSSVNIGKTDLHLGDVIQSEYLDRGVYEYDPCHLHYHFQHYENYLFGETTGRKTGFCLQTTWRYHNNEYTKFNTPYSFCNYQGISVGWGDDYYAGLDCQWIDVTGLTPANYDLKIILNPDLFLCEGTPILDSAGNKQWIQTNFTSINNKTVYRQACNFTNNFDKNNVEGYLYNFIGINSIVTMPCKREATLSPTKDCGFELKIDNLNCTPGENTDVTVENTDMSHGVVRLCETSKVLGHSVQCEYVDNLANVQIKAKSKMNIKFKCPSMRSSSEPGGLYSIMVASLLPNDKIPNIILTEIGLLERLQRLLALIFWIGFNALDSIYKKIFNLFWGLLY